MNSCMRAISQHVPFSLLPIPTNLVRKAGGRIVVEQVVEEGEMVI